MHAGRKFSVSTLKGISGIDSRTETSSILRKEFGIFRNTNRVCLNDFGRTFSETSRTFRGSSETLQRAWENAENFSEDVEISYYQLFRTRLFRIPRYFELIGLSLHLKSTPLFQTCQKQGTRTNSQATEKEWGPSNSQDSSRYSFFAVEGAEIGGQRSQLSFSMNKSIGKKTKTTEHSKIF